MSDKHKILLVDDELNILKACTRLLRKLDVEVFQSTVPNEALEIFQSHDFSVVISDQRMPSMEGTEFLTRIREINDDPVRILLTGYADTQAAIDAINRGSVYRYLSKPWDNKEVIQIVADSIAEYEANRQRKNVKKVYESAWVQRSAFGGLM